MNDIILSPIKLDELQSLIQESVRVALSENQQSKTKNVPQSHADDLKLNIKQLAEYLHCSLPTIHKYKKDGVIPFYRLGRKVYFKKSEIDACAIVSTKSIENRMRRARGN